MKARSRIGFVWATVIGIAAIPVAAQDSTSNGTCLPGDALDPYQPVSQCRNYVTDLVPIVTSWGTEFGAAPIVKGSKTGSTSFSSLVSSQAVSRMPLQGQSFDGQTYSVWNSPGQGVNPLTNSSPGTISLAGTGNQFGLGFAEFGTTDAGEAYNAIISAQVRVLPDDPSRLYVTRTVAAINGVDFTQNTAQFGIGAVDSDGTVMFRGDGFGTTGDSIIGNNVWTVDPEARTCFTLNAFNALSPDGSDVPATSWIVQNAGTTHAVPNLVPQSVTGGAPLYIGPNFNSEYCRGTAGSVTCDLSHLTPDNVETRGVNAYYAGTCSVLGAADGGLTAIIGNDASSLTDSIILYGIGTSGNVTGTLALDLPTGGVTDPKTGFNTLQLDPAGINEFDHYHSQTPFRGGSSQVAIGRASDGSLLVAAEADHPSDGGANWPLNYIAVAKVDCVSGSVVWTMAGYTAIPEQEVGGPVGKPIFAGDPNKDGTVIGQMSRLDPVTGGLPLGPSVSAPMIDGAGNVWFLSAIELFNGPGTADNEFTVGLLRAVYDSSACGFDLELVLKRGDVLIGGNSGVPYQIDFLELADSGSVSSGTAFSGNISQAGHLGEDVSGIPQSDPNTLGGLAIKATITYDVDGDGQFTDCIDGGGTDEQYDVLMYVGSLQPGGGSGMPAASFVSTWLPEKPPFDVTRVTFSESPSAPIPPIPSGFFGPGSEPFFGEVGFRGTWVGPGDTSTIIQRMQDPVLPGVPSTDIVPIEMVQLQLTSLEPITVTYDDGQDPSLWRVEISLDTNQPSSGDMVVTRDQPNGGTFMSNIEIHPVFTFTDTQTGLVLQLPLADFGGNLILNTPVPVPWVQQVSPALDIFVNPGDVVVPGIAQLDPADVNSQVIIPFNMESLDNGNSVRHVNCPPSDRKYCIYDIVCIEGPCKECPLKGGKCFDAQCPNNTCAVKAGLHAFCGGPDCCIEFGPFDCAPLTNEFMCPPIDSCSCDPTPGACCFDDGSCIDGISEANCDGTWMGAGTTCGAFGACCLPGGACTESFQVCCELLLGGTFEGGTCDPEVECCFPDGSCADLDPECCMLEGGIPGTGSCDPPQQCCLPDGSCIDTDPDCCDLVFGGTPGAGTCQLQKCCLGGGACIDTDEDCCELVGGTPAGGLCEPVQACCLPGTGACINVEPTCCVIDFGGTPHAGPCQQPEACCNPADLSECDVLEPRCCMDRGWQPGGPGSDCDPMGVCCYDADGANGTKETCEEMSQACCDLIQAPHMFHPNETCGPEAACCYDGDNDGIMEGCEMMSQICCDNLGIPSMFHPGETCMPTGACCYDADGMNMTLETCEEMAQICCDNLPAGMARVFTAGATCNPDGACCYDLDNDGDAIFEACEDMAQICCQVTPQATSFVQGEDCTPTGVCCLDIDGDPDGIPEVCQGDISRSCCEDDPGFVSFHPGADCNPTGACCYDSDGDGFVDTCVDGLVEECCEDLPLGEFTPNVLCGPNAACCFDSNGNGVNDVCINTSQLCCDGLNGLWGPPGVVCGGVTGGCCYNPDPQTNAPRDCEEMDSLCCTDIGGIFSAGQPCGPVGACCWDGAAFPGVRENCAAVIPELCCSAWPSGVFQGGGTICAVTNSCCFDSNGNGDNDACAVMSVACCNDIPGFEVVPACLGDTNGDGIDEACDDCVPDCDKTNVECLNPSPEYDNRRPVGRLLNNGNGFCTGFIVAGPDCIMTNRHCITTDGTSTGPLGAVGNLSIEFNFECDQCTDGTCKLTDVYPVTGLIHENASLDYALLSVAGSPAATWGVATVDPSNLNINDAVYEIHHAGALKKGFDAGVVTSIEVPGVCDPATATEVGVSVIASGGASGSPVFRESNHCVSAVCHCGPDCMPGFAIPMSAIWPDAEPRILAAGCTPNVCGGQVTGACCTPNGVCQVVSPAACTVLGGVYQGNGTACQGVEGCCFADGTCSNIDRLCCMQQGGTPQGTGTVCLGDSNGDNIDDLCGAGCPLSDPVLPENKLGEVCVTDADCSNLSVCIDGSCYVPKNKYISFQPGNIGENVAIRVTLVQSPLFPALVGESWWVQPNNAADPDKTFRLGCTKHYRDWSTAPAVIHIGDENIVSGAVYAVETLHENCPQSDPDSFADAVDLPTTLLWGDCCGALQGGAYLPPDGVANLGDVFAAVLGFQNAPNRPNREWVDVDPDVPNGTVNLADVFRFVQAFQGSGYPYTGPIACP